MVGRVGFEPTMFFRRRIMSPLPATNTASGPSTYATFHLMMRRESRRVEYSRYLVVPSVNLKRGRRSS